MAIARDATSDALNSASWNHTCGASATVLFVQCYALNDTVTSVTYNGTAMTLVGKTSFLGGSRQGTYLYYLVNPSTGSAFSVSVTGGTGVGATSFSGTLTTASVIDSSAVNNKDTSSTSITLTTTVVNTSCWLICAEADAAGGETAGAGTTVRVTNANGLAFADSNGTVGTGSQSLVINYPSTSFNAGVIASIAPSAGATSTRDARFLSLLGVG